MYACYGLAHRPNEVLCQHRLLPLCDKTPLFPCQCIEWLGKHLLRCSLSWWVIITIDYSFSEFFCFKPPWSLPSCSMLINRCWGLSLCFSSSYSKLTWWSCFTIYYYLISQLWAKSPQQFRGKIPWTWTGVRWKSNTFGPSSDFER